MRAIVDRRERARRQSLAFREKLYFMHEISEMLVSHPSLGEQFPPIVLRVVQLHDERLDYPSKLDRTSGFIECLLDACRKCRPLLRGRIALASGARLAHEERRRAALRCAVCARLGEGAAVCRPAVLGVR